MSKKMIETHLAIMRQYIAQGAERLSRQHEIITEMETRGKEADEARRALASFQDAQVQFIAHHDRLEQKLAGLLQQDRPSASG